MYFPISDKEERFKLPNSSNVITSTGDDSNVLSFKYEPVTINSSSVELKIERKKERGSIKINLKDFALQPDKELEAILNDDKVFLGGPVTPFSPFVLHSLEKKYDETHAITSEIGVSSKPDIIQSILNKNFPDKFIVSFGYTGWSSGQLEKEIQQGSWVIIPANEQIIFSTKSDKKIEEASKLAGFNLNLVSSNYGKA